MRPLLELGAAVESAISASGLILTRCAGYYGHDLSAYVERTRGGVRQSIFVCADSVRRSWLVSGILSSPDFLTGAGHPSEQSTS